MSSSSRLISVNVGDVREATWRGRTVSTGIFKTPVDGPVRARGVNLEGDDQADRSVHGGPEKAVYAFASEHYPAWREAFPEVDLPWGAFGENLTTEGLLEPDVRVGDRFRVGTVELTVTQPRMPCYKFAIRLGDPRVLKHMIDTGQTGFYLMISREGRLQRGDVIERVDGPPRPCAGLTIARLHELLHDPAPSREALQEAARANSLPESWRQWLERRAGQLSDAAQVHPPDS